MALSFRPRCAAFGRGLLPHQHVGAAMNLLLATAPFVVTLPRLPHRGGRDADLRQTLAGFPGLVSDGQGEPLYVDRDVAERGLDRLALAYLRDDVIAGLPSGEQLADQAECVRMLGVANRPRALVYETLGPVSLALTLTDEEERPLLYTPELRETVVQHLALRAGWQVAQLRSHATDVVVCLDEPMFAALESPFCPLERDEGLALVDRVLRNIEAVRALAVGGAVNWSLLLALPLDLLVCDVYEQSGALVEATDALGPFLERGGVIAYGLVPPDAASLERETTASCCARFEQLLGELVRHGLPQEKLVQAALITTSGGLAHLSPAMSAQALGLCAQVAAELRTTYTL